MAMMTMLVNRALSYLLQSLFLTLILVEMASGFSFRATDEEFNRWPEECKLIWASTQVTHFSSLYPRKERYEMKKLAGDRWGGAWHWCAALTFIERGNREQDKRKRKYLYKQAMGNANHTYVLAWVSEPKRAEFGVTLAQAQRLYGEPEKAVKVLAEVISSYPDYPGAYSLLSLIYRENGELQKAQEVLLKGNHNTRERSAEIQYFLGLHYARQGDLEKAEQFSDKAYALGYPLPGLKNKLKRLKATAAKEKEKEKAKAAAEIPEAVTPATEPVAADAS